jgi:hypothetical protein
MSQLCDQDDGATKPEAIITTPTASNSERESATPLRVLCFDAHNTCSRLFSKSLSNYLKLGRIDHPYIVAATLGTERIHTKVGNEQTRNLWDTRAAEAPDRVKSITYENATNKLLRDADKLEQKVDKQVCLYLDVITSNTHCRARLYLLLSPLLS